MPVTDETPTEVQVITRRWAGEHGLESLQESDDSWVFTAEDGMRYQVWKPGADYPCFEDDGRPCGTSRDSKYWTVRCWTDAPDAFWTVTTEGLYQGWGESEWLW